MVSKSNGDGHQGGEDAGERRISDQLFHCLVNFNMTAGRAAVLPAVTVVALWIELYAIRAIAGRTIQVPGKVQIINEIVDRQTI